MRKISVPTQKRHRKDLRLYLRFIFVTGIETVLKKLMWVSNWCDHAGKVKSITLEPKSRAEMRSRWLIRDTLCLLPLTIT